MGDVASAAWAPAISTGGRLISRRTVLWLCLLAAVINLAALATQTILPWNGDAGFDSAPMGKPFIDRVTSVHGPALKAGLRIGDQYDDRYRASHLENWAVPGQPYRVMVLRGGTEVPITIIPTRAPFTWDSVLHFFGVFWLLALAAMIASRGENATRSALLAMILVTMAFEGGLFRLMLPWAIPAICIYVVSQLISIEAVFAAFLVTNFGQPLSRARRSLLWATLAWVALYEVVTIAWLAGILSPWFDVGAAPWFTWFQYAFYNLGTVAVLLGAVLAFRASPAEDKPRIAWIFGSLGSLWVIGIVKFTALTLATIPNATPLAVSVYNATWTTYNASLFVVPLGLTYAALSRRLFDIGFVLNRAAVFAGVSAIVVGSFVLLEWALGKWFENASHATSLALNIALALGLGLSLNYIHRKVDHVVDTVFFRKRNEDERALRRFALESAFITDHQTLLERAYAEVIDHTEARSAAILLLEGDHFAIRQGSANGVARIDLNDPAVLSMRTWHDAVDLQGRSTAIEGEYAFPMLSHGTLIGILVCGAKKSGESFAPDEIDALNTVAHGVGVALVSLSKEPTDSLESLRGAIIMMQESIASSHREIIAELRAFKNT